jgi:methionyl-tRNA formyltransferase
MPILQALGRRRVDEIATGNGLDFGPIDDAVLVGSVNDSGTLSALLDAGPSLVVVHGTRIISERVLREIEVPVVNVHAGITPRYRGVHGGYWAILDDRPDLAGTTVHLVDAGIDTGGILGQATFERRAKDTIATYPYLHLACGLPVLVETVTTLLGGGVPQVVPPLPGAEVSQLHWHPTAWGYMAARLRRGVR